MDMILNGHDLKCEHSYILHFCSLSTSYWLCLCQETPISSGNRFCPPELCTGGWNMAEWSPRRSGHEDRDTETTEDLYRK